RGTEPPMTPGCNPQQHLSRRALMKGTLTTGAGLAAATAGLGGDVVMNWGGLTSQSAFAETVAREKKHCIYLFMNAGPSQSRYGHSERSLSKCSPCVSP